MCDRAISKNHYEVLGISPTASTDDIRSAFRRLAREHHPDTSVHPNSAKTMSEINRAWSVLSDPVKRFEYDRSLRSGEPSVKSVHRESQDFVHVSPTAPVYPARFPWRGILFFAVVAIVAVLVMHATAKPVGPEVPDNLLVAGSCIQIDTERFAREVSCMDSHDGIVRQLVALDKDCPSDTTGYLDRQGMGIACVDVSKATNKWDS